MESGVSENAVSGHIQLITPGKTACFAVRTDRRKGDRVVIGWSLVSVRSTVDSRQ